MYIVVLQFLSVPYKMDQVPRIMYNKPVLPPLLYYLWYDKPLTKQQKAVYSTAFLKFVVKFFFPKVIHRFLPPNYIGTYIHRGIQVFRFLSMRNSRSLIFRD